MAYCCGNIGFDGKPGNMYDKILGGFGMILLPRGSPYGDDKSPSRVGSVVSHQIVIWRLNESTKSCNNLQSTINWPDALTPRIEREQSTTYDDL